MSKERLPHLTTPMLPTLVQKPFDRKEWIFEIKWDGYRAIAEKNGKQIALYSRNNIKLNDTYPTIVRALAAIKHTFAIDGEIVVLDKEGRSHFQLLQDYNRSSAGTLLYYVFDLIYLDGKNLMNTPLVERKKLLKTIVPRRSLIKFSDHIAERGKAFFAAAKKQKLEGIVGKDGNSPYVAGRTRLWQKVKIVHEQETVIVGFTKPRRSRAYFGALVLAVYEKKKLTFVGHSGSGFTQKTLRELYELMEPLATKRCPFAQLPPLNEAVTWIKPKLVAQIKFAEWTRDGIMRQPIFLGLRNDKKPSDIHREGFR